ncbi:MAG: ABC transporter permease [Chitinophagales bacterium]|nr:ABC transporter permease [Hyphomicrobiales bacterium]
MNPTLSRAAWLGGSVFALILIWAIAAALADPRYLPSPLKVASAMTVGVQNGELLYHVGVTIARVAVSFFIAMLIGSAIGIAMGRSSLFNQFFDSWLTLFLNLPALVTIILCYIWFGLNEPAAIAAVVLNKIPNVAVTMREGARALSPDYSQMAQVYYLSRWKTFRHVTLPQLAPFFAASTRSGLSLVWKIVLVVELLGRPNGVGFQLQTYFQLFDVANILAYAIAFIIVVQLIEMFALQPWERSVNRWRQ